MRRLAGTNQTPQADTSTDGLQSPAEINNEVVKTLSDENKGRYLVDANGITLYTYDKDTTSEPSTCVDTCADSWKAYTTTTPASPFPTDISVTRTPDGKIQYAFKGSNLYYFANDSVTGDITGDGIGGVWHIIIP